AALVTPEVSWTGEELWGRAAGAAAWLDAVGAPEDEPVPVVVQSSASAVALLVGGAHSRRPLAPIGPKQAQRELAACLARYPSSPVVVADAPFADVARAAALATQRVEVVEELAPSTRPLDDDPDPDALVVVLHTSGTSGVPKAVPVTQWRLAARVAHSVA